MLVCLVLVVGAVGWATVKYLQFMAVPETRLGLGEHYPDMPPDDRHLYLDLPLDHGDEQSATFRAFYALSPGFTRERPVVFFLTDGQMELVGINPDFAWFDQYLEGVSYVVIGHRGHAPTQFPEVFTDGELDLRAAMRLYGSWQHVEDIERVRQDMQSRGLLPDGRISLFGASGAGIVAQQYLHRYGQHVDRTVLQATGAPDLAQAHGWQYSPSLAAFSPEAAELLAPLLAAGELDRAKTAYLLYQETRRAPWPRQRLLELAERIAGGHRAFEYGWVGPSSNLAVASFVLDSPSAAAIKVRMFELLGHDLLDYEPEGADFNLLYEWGSGALAELVLAERRGSIERPDLTVDRSRHGGEVLVLAGREDVVFSTAIAQAVVEAYPHSRLAVFAGGHSKLADPEHLRRLRVEFFREGLDSEAFAARLADSEPVVTRP